MMNGFVSRALATIMSNTNNGQNMTETQRNLVDAVRTNDATKGEAIAMNLCNTMGKTKEQAIAEARQFFGV